MAERTVRVPDEPGWWQWRRTSGDRDWGFRCVVRATHPSTKQRVLVFIGDGPAREVGFQHYIEWRGPIPEPTPEQWEMSE